MARLKRKRKKQNNFAIIRNSLLRITALLVIVSLNWTGLSAVIETFAYMNDTEASSGNSYSTGTLDFSLDLPPDFSPEVTPTQSSSRNISLINDGSLGFQYTASTSNFSGELCDYLDLSAVLDGNFVASSSLKNFLYNAGEYIAAEDWQFTATLTDDDPALQNKTCTFDFVFDGTQIEGAGFYDQEIIPNTINSGSWTEPTTSGYSPIIDSYVNEKSPNSNYGNDSELEVRSKNCPNPLGNKRTFIEFDFHFPAGTIINSAFLKLYMKDAPSEDRTYEARRVLAYWKERDPGPGDGIDWNNQPAVEGVTNSVSSGDTNPKWLEWNITSDVQGFVDGTYSNYGWRLSDGVESSETPYEAKFHSRESNTVDKRPVLEITFTPPEVTTTYPVINEVYYDVASGKGNDPNNEWVEIYNPTDSVVDISGWKICEAGGCDTIPSITPIPSYGFAVISGKASTWEDFWTLPEGTITIDLSGDKIGSNGLRDSGDRVILKNASNAVIDAMSYGDDDSQLNPSVSLSGKGKSLARIVKGYDTNSANDWIINASPNPGTNPSIGGIETIMFTYQGIEFLGSEPASTEEGESNDLPEEEDFIEEDLIIEETSTITEEPVGGEEPIIEENQEQGIIDEIVDVVIEEILPENEPTNEETLVEEAPSTDESTVIEENQATEEPVIEEVPVFEEQPVIAPPENNSVEQVPPADNSSGGSDGVSSDVGSSNAGSSDTGVSGEAALGE